MVRVVIFVVTVLVSLSSTAAAPGSHTSSQPELHNSCIDDPTSWGCILLECFDFLSSEGLQDDFFGSSNASEDRTWRINRRTVVPLVVGVAVKFFSVIPLVLGKLTLLGTLAILAAKTSLFLSLIMSLKKFFGEGGFLSLNPLGHFAPPPQHYHPHEYDHHSGHQRRRTTYVVRGRSSDDQRVLDAIDKWEVATGSTEISKSEPQIQKPKLEVTTYLPHTP